jgi:glycosyltransferase involved in cell wall biosynthesis
MFQPTEAPPPENPTILMVGGWSYRKGCDVLVEALRQLSGVKLLHVGPVLDCPLPNEPWFEHHDPVHQSKLVEFYARGHVFALASREEGLPFVQAQALACGLPLVCTDRTGGEDLAQHLGAAERITVVPHDNAAALAAALKKSLGRALKERGLRQHLGASLNSLSWRAYAERYVRYVNEQRRGGLRAATAVPASEARR